MPQIDPQIVGGHERFLIAIERDRVDVIGVCVGEDAFGYGFNLDAVQVPDYGYTDRTYVSVHVITNAYMGRRAGKTV